MWWAISWKQIINKKKKEFRLVLPLNCGRLSEHEVSWGESLAIYLSLHEIGNYWSAHAIGTLLSCFRSCVGVKCIYSNYVFTAKIRKKKKKKRYGTLLTKCHALPSFVWKIKEIFSKSLCPRHRCSFCHCVMHIFCISNTPGGSRCYFCSWFHFITNRSFWEQQEGIFFRNCEKNVAPCALKGSAPPGVLCLGVQGCSFQQLLPTHGGRALWSASGYPSFSPNPQTIHSRDSC